MFALDTGRLPDETYMTAERVREKYHLRSSGSSRTARRSRRLERQKGLYSFFESLDNRHECCGIRKVVPLGRALASLDAWVTGLRREQSVTRTDTPEIEVDANHGDMAKINPIIAWTEPNRCGPTPTQNRVPIHPLHDKGYPSIGCAPCTRAIEPGEHPRAGRWWWENPENKECGLHPFKSAGSWRDALRAAGQIASMSSGPRLRWRTRSAVHQLDRRAPSPVISLWLSCSARSQLLRPPPRPASIVEASIGKGAQVSPDTQAEPLSIMIAPGVQLLSGILRLELGILNSLPDVENSQYNLEFRPMVVVSPPILPIYGRGILAGHQHPGPRRRQARGGLRRRCRADVRSGPAIGVFGEVGALPRQPQRRALLIVEGRAGVYLGF